MIKPIKKNTQNLWGFNNNKNPKKISIFTPVSKNVFSKRTLIQPVKNPIKSPIRNLYNFHPKKMKTDFVIDNRQVKRKDMNWIQAKKKYPNLNPYADSDGDGLMNMYDCKPFDKLRQDELTNKGKSSNFRKGVMSERAKRKYNEKIKKEKERVKKEKTLLKIYARERIKIARPLKPYTEISEMVRKDVLPKFKFDKKTTFNDNIEKFEEKRLPIILKTIPTKKITEKYIESLDNIKDSDRTNSLLKKIDTNLEGVTRVINSSFNIKKTAYAKSMLKTLLAAEKDIIDKKIKTTIEKEKNIKELENLNKMQYQKDRKLKRIYSDTDEMFTPEGLKYLKRKSIDPVGVLKEKRDFPIFKDEIIDYDKEKKWYNEELIKKEKEKRLPELEKIYTERTPKKKETFIEKSTRKIKDLLYPPESEFEDKIEKDVSDRLMKEETELKDIQKKAEMAEKEIARELKMDKIEEAKEKKIKEAEDKIEKLKEIKEEKKQKEKLIDEIQ